MDYSVLDEMASRLRGAGLWDNSLGDGLALMKKKIELMEESFRFERHAYDRIPRPLADWQAARSLLVVIASRCVDCFADLPLAIHAVLSLAVWMDRWERDGWPVPEDIREIGAGMVSVSWTDPYRYILVCANGAHPSENFDKWEKKTKEVEPSLF